MVFDDALLKVCVAATAGRTGTTNGASKPVTNVTARATLKRFTSRVVCQDVHRTISPLLAAGTVNSPTAHSRDCPTHSSPSMSATMGRASVQSHHPAQRYTSGRIRLGDYPHPPQAAPASAVAYLKGSLAHRSHCRALRCLDATGAG